MANATTQSVVRQIESLYAGSSIAGLTDQELLDRFLARRDSSSEDAFAALVARHGPMVLAVCRNHLADGHDADDAFQAAFLVLASRARSIRNPDLLSNWLYGIALSHRGEGQSPVGPATEDRRNPGCRTPRSCNGHATSNGDWREEVEAIHAEIARLPASFRAPIVLCYFEGLTLDQAALRLRCPAGTIHSRLVRARTKLQRALTRRGIVMSVAAWAAALSARTARAAVSSHLCEATTRAALAASESTRPVTLAAALAHEVLRSMTYHKLKIVSLTVLLLGAVTMIAGYLTHAPAREAEPKRPAAAQQPAPPPDPEDANQKAAPGRMFVAGRVLDAQGRPVPGAMVMLLARNSGSPLPRQQRLLPIGAAQADASGQFRIDAPRTSSSHFFNDLGAVALAPGFGAAWSVLDVDADEPAADITLRPEQIIRGRLLDLQGAARPRRYRLGPIAQPKPPAKPGHKPAILPGRHLPAGAGQRLTGLAKTSKNQP